MSFQHDCMVMDTVTVLFTSQWLLERQQMVLAILRIDVEVAK